MEGSGHRTRILRPAYTDDDDDDKHTSTWPVITWTLSHVITSSFWLNLHSISTCVQITYKLVSNLQIPLWRVQLGRRHIATNVSVWSVLIISLLHLHKKHNRVTTLHWVHKESFQWSISTVKNKFFKIWSNVQDQSRIWWPNIWSKTKLNLNNSV